MDNKAKKITGFIVAGVGLVVISKFAPSTAAGLVLVALLGVALVKADDIAAAINGFRGLL